MCGRLEKYKGRKDIPPFLIIGDNLISNKENRILNIGQYRYLFIAVISKE